MNRNGMIAFAVLERLRDELLRYELEICQAADNPKIVLAHGKDRHPVVILQALDLQRCAPLIEKNFDVELLLRAYRATHDERKKTIVWMLAHIAQAYARIHNERLLTLSAQHTEFLMKYVEVTASELGVSEMSQPLHAAFACYLIESSSWL